MWVLLSACHVLLKADSGRLPLLTSFFSHASALLVPRCCECRRVSLRRFGCVFCRHKGSGTWFLGWLGVWGVLPCVCQELYCGILLDNDYQEKRIKELCRAENVRPEKMQRLLKQGKALL